MDVQLMHTRFIQAYETFIRVEHALTSAHVERTGDFGWCQTRLPPPSTDTDPFVLYGGAYNRRRHILDNLPHAYRGFFQEKASEAHFTRLYDALEESVDAYMRLIYPGWDEDPIVQYVDSVVLIKDATLARMRHAFVTGDGESLCSAKYLLRMGWAVENLNRRLICSGRIGLQEVPGERARLEESFKSSI